MQDLLESLTYFDIPHHSGVNPKAVKIDNVRQLLEMMDIKNVVEFGAYYNNDKPFMRFAQTYRDIYIFSISFDIATEMNK